MLSAEAYSFRQMSRLAISLSWIAGFTNVIVLFACGSVVSHMTGNTTWLGRSLGSRNWAEAEFYGFLIVSFLCGAIISALMTELARRRGVVSKYILPLAVEAVLLTLFMLGLKHYPKTDTGLPRLELLAVSALAMGLQNATITKISGAVVRSTHLTGVITDLGIELVQFSLWAWDQLRGRLWQRTGRLLRVSQRHPTALRLALLASIFGSFLFGASAGALAFERFAGDALLAPVAFLVFIIGIDYRRPISDIREIDLTRDPELKVHGIVQNLLPPGVSIYRLVSHHKDRSRAPNFQHWVDHVPRSAHVVILVLSPWLKFNTNAVMDLSRAADKLRQQHKWLVISGITPVQYKTLDHEGFVEKVGPSNICPDLEFAIAQALEVDRHARQHGLQLA